jgi:hypothetical protein
VEIDRKPQAAFVEVGVSRADLICSNSLRPQLLRIEDDGPQKAPRQHRGLESRSTPFIINGGRTKDVIGLACLSVAGYYVATRKMMMATGFATGGSMTPPVVTAVAGGWRSGRSYFGRRLFRSDRQDSAGHLFPPKRAYRRAGYFSR